MTANDPWTAALDRFEAILDSYERVATEDDDPDTTPWPPPGLGALPPEHSERARALLRRARVLESTLTGLRQEIRAIPQRPHQPQHRRSSRPTITAEL